MTLEYKENILNYEYYQLLRKSVGWIELPEIQINVALKNSLYTITVFDSENVIGMGRLVGDGIYFMISDIVVHPDYQGIGIGKSIMNKIINYTEKQIPSGGRASIQLISEKGKEIFYEKLGFKRIPNEFCGSGMRKVIYKNR